MGRPGTIETIDMLSELVPVIRYRLAGRDLEVLSEAIVGIASHLVSLLGILICFIRCMAKIQMPEHSFEALVRVGVLQGVEVLA